MWFIKSGTSLKTEYYNYLQFNNNNLLLISLKITNKQIPTKYHKIECYEIILW